MQHLGSNNHRFLCQNTFFDQQTLNAGNSFLRNLNAQVTTSHHDSVGHFQYFINIVHSFLIFDLGDNLNVAAVCIQYLTDIQHILLITNKRMCYEINVLFNSIQYIVTVLFCQRREIDAHARYIHTLTVTQSSFILHLTQQILVCLLNHTQLQITIINQNIAIHLEIMHKTGIRYSNTFTGRFLCRIAYNLHFVTNLIRNRLAARNSSSTHFGPFCVHQYGNTVGNLTYIGYQFFNTFTRCVSRIHTDHIHTGLEKISYKLYLATLI